MIKKIYLLFFVMFLLGTHAMSQLPVVTVRFANPQFDCTTETYCLDVEFLSDSADVQVFGMNVRFFYDDSVLEFMSFSDFQGGYGITSPNPPIITTGLPNTGPALFSLSGAAEYVNGAIQLVNQAAEPVYLSTTAWTKLFSICFAVEDINALDNPQFCPSVIWDLESDPDNGGFLTGSNGVVISIVAPPPFDSNPTIENVVQYNWAYNANIGFPFGFTEQSTCISTVCGEIQPDISITKTADPVTYSFVGDIITYTIAVTNTGDVDLTDVLVSDPLLDFNRTIPLLESGESIVYNETYIITPSDVQAGSFINTATAEGRDPLNGTVSDTDDAVIILDAPDFPALVITKYTPSNLVNAGDEVVFIMEVTNYGAGTATNVVVTDTLQDGFIFMSASHNGIYNIDGGFVMWDLGNLGTNESILLEVSLIVADGIPHGTALTNRAYADADNVDSPAWSCLSKVIVVGDADILIAKTADVSNTYAGHTVNYTLIVSNTGPSQAVNVRVTDYLPVEASFVSASHNGVYNTQSHSIDWQIGDIDNGQTLSLSIVVQLDDEIPEGRSVINYAAVISDTNDPNPVNNTAIHIITITGPRSDVAVTKQSLQTAVPAGEYVEYTIVVTNHGPDNAQTVTVTDQLPVGLEFVSATENGYYNQELHTINWDFANITLGESIHITVIGRIASDTRGGTMLLNTVTASSPAIDPDPSNNEASATVEVTIPDLFIPDVFSPNGDGINDNFVIRGLERYPNNSIIIINRWGNKVFEAAPYNNDWDGSNQFGITVGGNQLPVGTYYYILDLGETGSSPIRRFIYLTR